MHLDISITSLLELGLDASSAKKLNEEIQTELQNKTDPISAWQHLSKLLYKKYPFKIHLLIFALLFPDWPKKPESAPAWIPTEQNKQTANISHFMTQLELLDVKSFHRWTVEHREEFWEWVIDHLNIPFKNQPSEICDLSQGVESPVWFPNGKINIIDSCFLADPDATALIYTDQHTLHKMTYQALDQLANRIANGLIEHDFQAGDAIAIAMPMTHYAVAIYLGIIKMGGIVVSIADSFSSQEMATRLSITKAKGIFTQDFISWAGKILPLYEKVKEANAPRAIVLSYKDKDPTLNLRTEDLGWKNFLSQHDQFISVPCDPMSACNILFSSGTTGEPKAIVWNHTTPIKVASDAFFHQNIKPHDILNWPTNLGWMMGPWLIFAGLMNKASIALYPDAPKDRAFGEFIEKAKVTMLGVVPTLVSTWRQTACMEPLDWSAIKVFSSTGECSNPEDMLYLMSLAGYKPVIEYCGGTEIGSAYISSTVVENNYPSLFNTPTMGLDFIIIDEKGEPADIGEVAIIPPAIGLSTVLLNANHHQVYYANMPQTPNGQILRRHGDQIERLPQGHYLILGRVDDTMNLGGIKISAVEIERTLVGLPKITEVAAIAVNPSNHGPSQLVIYAAASEELDKHNIQQTMQKRINNSLNPLFKIHDVVFVKDLPKTASNKIMRRMLRKGYEQSSS